MKREEFSADKFKEWFEDNGSEKKFSMDKFMKSKELIGQIVESAISAKKLSSKIIVEHGDGDAIIKEFIKSGGEVMDIDGKTLLIEVKAGSFYLNKNYITES